METNYRLHPTEGLTFSWSTELRAVCSNTLLRCSRTLLPRSAILPRWWLARDTYVGKLFSASVTHLPLAGFHLFAMGMIIPTIHTSIVNRYMSEILLAMLANHANWTRGNRGTEDPRNQNPAKRDIRIIRDRDLSRSVYLCDIEDSSPLSLLVKVVL